MQTLTREVIERELKNRVLTDALWRGIFEGTDQRRHHLVARAMNAGELIRLKRGRYVLAQRFRDYPPHPFALAQAFVPGSYVSFETALAHHAWIPESVRTTASVTPGRKSATYEHPNFGIFSFHPLALREGSFLNLVDRRQLNQQSALVARPFRALMDLVCLRKQEWRGLSWIVEGLRIDEEKLHSITSAEVRVLRLAYSQKRVQSFLNSLAKELGND
jgi:ureidoglycolate hydrolase